MVVHMRKFIGDHLHSARATPAQARQVEAFNFVDFTVYIL